MPQNKAWHKFDCPTCFAKVGEDCKMYKWDGRGKVKLGGGFHVAHAKRLNLIPIKRVPALKDPKYNRGLHPTGFCKYTRHKDCPGTGKYKYSKAQFNCTCSCHKKVLDNENQAIV